MSRAETCHTMEEVRRHIDRLDGELVVLLAERAAYVAQAGRIKKSPDQVRDPERIEEVVAKVRERAGLQGLDPDLAEAIWRAMIEAFIAYEARVFAARGESRGDS